MQFVKHFEKIADFDHNNQGLELKMADNEPTGNPDAGGKAPSGIPSYRPVDAMESGPTKKGKKNKLSDVAATQFIFGKMAQLTEDQTLTGSSGQGASTLVSQLKWTDDNGSDYTDRIGMSGGEKRVGRSLIKKILKARKS